MFCAVFLGAYQGAGVCLVPLQCHSTLWEKCAGRVQIICGIIVMYKEFLCNGTCIWEHIILFLVSSSSCHGTYVEKPVLSVGANLLTPPSCCRAFTPRRFLVRGGTIYVCFHYPVLCMARHKTVRSLLVYCLTLSTV